MNFFFRVVVVNIAILSSKSDSESLHTRPATSSSAARVVFGNSVTSVFEREEKKTGNLFIDIEILCVTHNVYAMAQCSGCLLSAAVGSDELVYVIFGRTCEMGGDESPDDL